MKSIQGLSLTELLLSISIVSVVGAGMYVGFQQIDSAAKIAEQVADSKRTEGLLLDLIEAEASFAGQGVEALDTICLVDSRSPFGSDCNGSVIRTENQSHGATLCRKVNGQFQTTLFYSSGPGEVKGGRNDLRCGDLENNFFHIYSYVHTSPSGCGLPENFGPENLKNENLRQPNLCQMKFERRAGGLGVTMQTSGRTIGQTEGNNFVFNTQGQLTSQVVAETAKVIVDFDDPYLIRFDQPKAYVAASAAGLAGFRLNRPALTDLSVNYIKTAQGGSSSTGAITINAGSSTGSIALVEGERLELLSTGEILAGSDNVFELAEIQNPSAPAKISLVIYDNEVEYDEGHVDFSLISDRALASDITVYIIATNNQNPSVVLDRNSNANAPAAIHAPGVNYSLEFDPRTPVNLPGDPRNGTYKVIMSAGTKKRTLQFKTHSFFTSPADTTTTPKEALGDQNFRLTLLDPSVLESEDSEFKYLVRQSDENLFSVRTSGQLPTMQWLRTSSEAEEPIGDEERITRLTVRADRSVTEDTDVSFTLAGTPSCAADGDYILSSGCSDSSRLITIPRGQDRGYLDLKLLPHPPIRASGSDIITLTLTDVQNNGYILASSASADITHNLTIVEKQVPSLSLASGSIQASFGGVSIVFSENTQTPTAFLSVTSPSLARETSNAPAEALINGSDAILLYEEVAPPSDWDGTTPYWIAGSAPISLTGVPSDNGLVYITVASAAGSDHLSIGDDIVFDANNNGIRETSDAVTAFELDFTQTGDLQSIPFNFWVKNDSEEEADERITLQINRATGDNVRPPEPGTTGYSYDLVVIDNDQCQLGGSMTIGSSRANDFHTVGSSDMETAMITAATVRISEGYDSSTDRLLIDGITPSTAVNMITYASGSITHSSTVYTGIQSTFFENQGVMEITRDTAMPAPAMVKFLNEKVFFKTTATSDASRKVTFTLGDAQAWDQHEDGTTHYYRFVPGDLIQFDAANTAAASDAKRYFGVKGYLATVTSRAENTFLGEKFNVNGGPPAGWLGAWDNTEGTWEWMNGPEKGRRFLSGNTGSGTQYKVIRGAGNGAGTPSSITRESYNQTVAVNGSGHQTNAWSPNSWSMASDLKNMRFDEYTETIVNGRVTHPNNPYRFANFADGEPNDAGAYEDKLQMTGNSVGGRLWNDLPGDLNTITGYYAAGTSPYNVSGYYQEFGGPLKSEWGFANRKFSQTNTFNARSCGTAKETSGVGLKTTSCRTYSYLTIGSGASAASGLDFYGPNTTVSNELIDSARVSISSGYVSGTDELVIAGETPTTAVGQKKYLDLSITYGSTTYDHIDAIFYTNQGVLEITKYDGDDSTTKDTMPAAAMVQFFNEKVELVIDPPSNANVTNNPREVTYTLGEAQAWFGHPDGGDRYYRYIPGNHSWTTARDRAEDSAREYFGVRGYLATITSYAENQILAQKFNDNGGPPSGWLGGNDNQTEGEWRWMRGPERYMRFWKNNGGNGKQIVGNFVAASSATYQGSDIATDNKSCVAQDSVWNNNSSPANGHTKRLNWGYSESLVNGVPVAAGNKRFAFWSCASSTNGTNKMEPNNSGPENFLQMQGSAAGGGMWNDLPLSPGSSGTYGVKGYYVEYGGPADNNGQNDAEWAHTFENRRLGRTLRVNPKECAMIRVD